MHHDKVQSDVPALFVHHSREGGDLDLATLPRRMGWGEGIYPRKNAILTNWGKGVIISTKKLSFRGGIL